ncbi:MAG: DUF4936 family protein [Pseudomonadota bacterium]
MVDLYIYYRVNEVHVEELAGRVLAMQARLAASHGVKGTLKRRPEAQDGQQTWMEIYPASGDGFAAVLQAAESEAAIAALIDGKRHTEIFMDFSPCA